MVLSLARVTLCLWNWTPIPIPLFLVTKWCRPWSPTRQLLLLAAGWNPSLPTLIRPDPPPVLPVPPRRLKWNPLKLTTP